MKLPKKYFESLSNIRYREYLKLLPDMKHDNTRIITAFIFTFIAMSFFGIFAINPTLSTIVTLKKQLADSTLVNEKLGTKINNLSSLQSEYGLLEPDLPVAFNAIPNKIQTASLLGQIIALSQKTKIKTMSLSVANVQLSGDKNSSEGASFNFSLEAQGQYNDLLDFTKSLTKIDRVISVDSISLSKISQSTLVLNLHGKGYFKNDL